MAPPDRDPAPDGTRGKYYILTWGCQMNVHDSEKLAGTLEEQGYRQARGAQDADVILLNTCAVREKAAEKVFSALGRLRPFKLRNPDLVLGVCGCVAQQEGERIYQRAPHVDLVLGPRATGTLPLALPRARSAGEPLRITDTEVRDDSIRFPFERIRRQGTSPAKAYTTIVEGCNHACTFCIVPRTRGRESYRDSQDVLAEVRHLAGRGVVEIEFLGQTVNAYRDAAGTTLADLLCSTAEIDGIERIRFTTSHPAQMTDRLMDAMAAAQPKVCPYLHLPVQSGASSVLKTMKRGYDREGYLRKVEGLRRRIPDLSLGTDVIVGFPTEREEDFQETLSLLDEVRFDTVFAYTYSSRPGTAAADLADPVPELEKLDRLRRLQARQQEIQEDRNRQWVGREVQVLVEGPSKRDPGAWCGRTSDNRVVNFSGSTAPGRLQNVRIRASSAYALRGEIPPAALDLR